MSTFLKKWGEVNAAFDPKKPSAIQKLGDIVDVLLAGKLPEVIDSEIVIPQQAYNDDIKTRVQKLEETLIQVLTKFVELEEAYKKQGLKIKSAPLSVPATVKK